MDVNNVLLKTNLPYTLFKRGKVRDIYDLGKNLLIVSTDRISAFDVVLPDGIPHKGQALNLLSVYWFKETEHILPNHLLEEVNTRTILVKKSEPIKAEFVVRGYLYGSAWEKYKKGEEIYGNKLPPGLKKAEKLPEPILTPTTKAEVGHDVELTRDQAAKLVGKSILSEIEEYCLKIYENASRKAEEKEIIIADTKFEFGMYEGSILLIDEILTPDSSRFWPKNQYKVGADQPSFDKQYVRDYLTSTGWNKQPPAPHLPKEVIIETSRRYIEAYEKLTGQKFFNKIVKK
ncbi:phosphoribosylaminoimidazolesuccinocarboxamide synthase [Candidatus Bathyarchaeota archaeon]|nr:phosphoribosylaminoimidazolesuccinocarboxamide synthase [Candidatus Bathyarchaeota archaeon]